VRSSTGSRPQDLGLSGVQLEPVGTHPRGDVINVVGDGVVTKKGKLRWFGHVECKDDTDWIKC